MELFSHVLKNKAKKTALSPPTEHFRRSQIVPRDKLKKPKANRVGRKKYSSI